MPATAARPGTASCCRPTSWHSSRAATFGAPCGEPGPRGDTKVVGTDLPDGWLGLDIGPETATAFAEAVADGPHGAVERAARRRSRTTGSPAGPVASPRPSPTAPGFTVVGGGDSASALEQLGLADRIDFLSTGGGASLKLVEYGDLPGLAALRAAPNAPARPVLRPATAGPAPFRPEPPADVDGERQEVRDRRPLVSGNWKMHHDHLEALHLVRDLGLRLNRRTSAPVDVSVHPPFTDLRTVQTLVEGERIPVALGAQHCHDHDRGAFTGEVSPQMLARLGVGYVIVGHSERRQLFGMTDEMVAATLRAVLRHAMTPICCVGETGDERDGRTHRGACCPPRSGRPWTGSRPTRSAASSSPTSRSGPSAPARAATPVDAEDACVFIRGLVGELAGPEAAGTVRVQYGGSVNAENAADLMAEPDVDGLLVGGASLQAGSFARRHPGRRGLLPFLSRP